MKTSYIQKFINHLIGKAIVQYKMINDGDRILVAVSGGKDSLTLLWFLRERLKWIPIDYEIIAIHVDMGFSIRSGDKMEAFFKSNNFNYKIITLKKCFHLVPTSYAKSHIYVNRDNFIIYWNPFKSFSQTP